LEKTRKSGGRRLYPLAYIPQKGIFLTREHPAERREENRSLPSFPFFLASLAAFSSLILYSLTLQQPQKYNNKKKKLL
jgi:hypothetical protein